MATEPLLRGAYDLHVHGAPDVVPRAQDPLTLAQEAQQAGMAGIALKDHTTSTVGLAHALNLLYPDGPRFLGTLTLNPPSSGLNPYAVEAALREGATIIWFPTYGARNHLLVAGRTFFASTFPRPGGDWPGITLHDDAGAIKPEVHTIVELIARFDAVLATGHLAPVESLALLRLAREKGVRRMIFTHASTHITPATLDQQREAVAAGAWIEHCLLPVGLDSPGTLTIEELVGQIRAIGPERIIVTSDLGKADRGPIVGGFSRYIGQLRAAGLRDDEIRLMIAENPEKLLAGR